MENENLSTFIWKNAWQLIVAVISIVIAFTMLSSRVNVIAQEHVTLNTKLDTLTDLTARIVRLEEGRQVNADNIAEIKDDIKTINADIKDIKRHFEIK